MRHDSVLRAQETPTVESTTRTHLVPMIARVSLFLGLLALVGCASTPPPSWLGERPAAYTDERWVVAVGHGADAAAAEAAARAEIVRQTN
jgi:hypothetical protein